MHIKQKHRFMRSFGIILLGVVNFVGFALFGVIVYSFISRPSTYHYVDAIIVALLFLIISLADLICGIATIRKKKFKWGVIGLVVTVLYGVIIVFWAFVQSMGM
jgi:hypothetical protein